MRLWLRAALALLALADLSDQAFGPYPSITNETFIKWVVDVHNKYRSEVNPTATNMLYMTWDVALARTARAWGNKCVFEHSPYTDSHPDPKLRPIGENIWLSNAAKRPFQPHGAIRAWHDEVRYYNFQTQGCTHVCGHYTQVVWDTSYKVGCAIVFCSKFGKDTDREIFVCNYGPGGNYPRQPYRRGRPCSECPQGDTCENKLCKLGEVFRCSFCTGTKAIHVNAETIIRSTTVTGNPNRDKIIWYTRWYPSFEFRIVCDESCIALAILRPSLMFLAFGVVYYLQHRYPGLDLQQ